MSNLVPSTPAKLYSLSAAAVGFILIDDLTPAEQNSLGNWFMLLAQVLCTNAAQQQLINNRTNNSTGNNSHIVNDNQNNSPNQIEMLEKTIDALRKEIINLKNTQ